MAIDLCDAKWPTPPSRNPEFDTSSIHLRQAAKYHHNSFVQEGTMVAMPLAFPGVTTPVPADECAIVSMAMDANGMVLCGTRTTPGRALREGAGAHMLVAMTRGVTGLVHDLGVIPGASACTSILPVDGAIYLTTSGPSGGAIYRHPAIPLPYDCLQEWGFSRPGYEELARPVEGEGIAAAVLDNTDGVVYGISDRTGTFFRFDPGDGTTTTFGKVDGLHRFSRVLVKDLDGRTWGTSTRGRLWRFDPETEEVETTDMRIPAAAGRDVHNQAESFALDPDTGVIYGAGSSDGYLFSLDPEADEVRSLGKPGASPTVRALTVGTDGRVFGICGGEDDLGHLFVYDPSNSTLRDLGVPVSLLGRRAYGYVYASAITGWDGELFFGQAERNSQLWIYFPPVASRTRLATGDAV